MTNDSGRLAREINAILEPTAEDHLRADRIVDQTLIRSDSRPPRRWVVPAAAAAALVLVGGVTVMSVRPQGATAPAPAASTGSASSPAGTSDTGDTDRDLDGLQFVDTRELLRHVGAIPSLAVRAGETSEPLRGQSVMVLNTAPSCEACGGQDYLRPILDSAAAQPTTSFLVIVHGVTPEQLKQARASVRVDNVHVAAAPNSPLLPVPEFGEGATSGPLLPSVARLSPMHTLTRVAAGSGGYRAALTAPPSTQTLTVTCSDAGPTVDRATVAAAPDGVHVRFVNISTKASANSFGGFIDDVERASWRSVEPGHPRSEVVALSPGQHDVGCSYRHTEPRVRITVTDPTRSWRGSAAQAGCSVAGMGSWAGGPGRGRTPAEAAADWPRGARGGAASTQPGVTLRPKAIGYVGAPQMTWILNRAGHPELLLRASLADDGSGYEASPAWACR